MNKVEIKIEEKDVNVRIDKLLLDYVENSSRTEIQNRLKEGNIVAVSYTHLTLPTIAAECRSRWSPYH